MTERDLGQKKISRNGPFRRLVDRLMGVPALTPHVLEAIGSLQKSGVAEPRRGQIYEEVQKVYPLKYSARTVREDETFNRTLDVLVERGKTACRWVTADEAADTNTDMGLAYRIVVEQTLPAAEQ